MKTRYNYLLAAISLALPLLLVQCKAGPPKVQELEWPPSLSAAVEKAPTVPYCELVRNPANFTDKIVRTTGVFFKNLENSVFRDPSCQEYYTWVEFDPAYVYADEALKNRFAELACLKQARCDGRARISAVGRFEGPNESGYGHLGCCPYRFSIMRIEEAEPVAAPIIEPGLR